MRRTYEITFSPTGGTKQAADILMEAFEGNREEISLLEQNKDYGAYEFGQDDICLIAVPSFGGRVPETAVERILQLNGNSAKAVLVCVYGNRAYDDTLLELKNAVKKAGFCPVAAAAAVAEHSIMRQYASGRPDAADRKELRSFSEKIWKKVSSAEQPAEVSVPGNESYREYNGVPLKPAAGRACNACGLCAKQCPVGAINAQNLKKTDKKKCISCMRCIAVCPRKARRLNKFMLAAASKKMAKAFAVKRENELFL